MCTAFRDGFQSVYGARVLTKDFLPALEAARDAGITWFEAGGGARFQSLYFYCNEDAFDMMDAFRQTTGPEANLQTLARGVNVVGLESQPPDVVRLHAELFKKHGITTIRNFDALNDVDNLIYSGQCIVEAGLKHQVCVTLMELPPGCSGAHNPDFYEATLQKILAAEIPFDAVCFKDASGTSVPATVHETILRARKILPKNTLIHFHTHETAGISVQAYQAALDAGADAIDLSLAPCSGGTCQPDILVMWHALRNSGYTLDVDVDKIRKAEEVFKDCMQDYFLPPESVSVEPLIPWSPMPGGALTANTQMMRDNGIMDKYPDLIRAMGEVVRRGGFGTSVTPVSQFYVQQALNNVMFGTWEKIAEPYGKMALGYFGKTPVQPDEEVIKIASQQLGLQPTTRHPLEMNEEDPNKGVEPAQKTLREANLPETDENIFIVATCQDKGLAFLKGEGTIGVRKVDKTESEDPIAAPRPAGTNEYKLDVNGKSYSVKIDGDNVIVDGKTFRVKLEQESTSESSSTASAQGSSQQSSEAGSVSEITAQMPGTVLRVLVNEGDVVQNGDTILIVEAMKMEVPVTAPAAGTIHQLSIAVGDHVTAGQVLTTISEI